MKRTLVLLLFFVLYLHSCNRGITHQLEIAADILDLYPDSALVIMRRIEPLSLISQSQKARYALLMSKALDKNYIDVRSDSLIMIAVNYYSEKGSAGDKMLSWYYLGIVQFNAEDYVQSVLSLEKAEQEANIVGDNLQLGLIFRNKANIYSLTNNNSAAIDNRIKAIEFFEKAGAKPYKEFAELSLAIDYSNQSDYSKADSLLTILLRDADNPILLSQCSIRKAGILVEQNQRPQEAIRLYRNNPRYLYRFLDYAYLAEAFEMLGQRDSSDYWLSEGYNQCVNQPDSATLDYLKSRIEYSREHYEEAFHLVDHATNVQDSLTRLLLQQSVSSSLRDYYKSETLLQEEKIQSMRQRTLFGIVFGILIMSLLAMTAVIRSRKKDQLLQKQMARLALEERELERVNRDNAHLVGSLFSEKIDHLDRLSDSYFKMDEGKDKELAFKQIKELVSTIRKDDNLFLSLEKDLDRYCNGIMSKLSSQVPRISGDNRRIIALFFAGYSYETVKLILNKVSVESLKTARSRFRKEIKESGAPDTDLFLKMLEMKKRPQAGTNENIVDC